MTLLTDDITNEYLKKCVRCGQCRYVCPVLDVVGKESASPRGKIYLAGMMQRKEVRPGPPTDSILSLCLTCGACSAECPSGLPVDSIIKSARAMSASLNPNTLERAAYRNVFSRIKILEKVPGFIPVLKQVMGKRPADKSIKYPPATIPLLTRAGKKRPLMRVGYFLGCATGYLMPEIASSAVRVLSHLGCEVITPPGANCCGLPLACAGEIKAAQKLHEINSRIFKSYQLDAIVTDCSSCSLHLTEAGFTGNSRPVYEFCEFLAKVLNPVKPQKEFNREIAVHYPCHLRYGRKQTGHLHEITGTIPGTLTKEITGGNSCCGGGGTFSVKQKAISNEILNKYSSRIMATGAQSVVTVCPSCIIQLSRGLDSRVTILHPAQILYSAYGLKD